MQMKHDGHRHFPERMQQRDQTDAGDIPHVDHVGLHSRHGMAERTG